MRTTLKIDDDVLGAAKEIGRRERKTAGAIISDLARRALMQPWWRRAGKFGSQGRAMASRRCLRGVPLSLTPWSAGCVSRNGA